MSLILRNLRLSQTLVRNISHSCCCQSIASYHATPYSVHSIAQNFAKTHSVHVVQTRSYAKGKDKPKEKVQRRKEVVIRIFTGGHHKLIQGAKEQMRLCAIESLKVDLSDEYVLARLAQISRKNPKTLIITCHHFSTSGMNNEIPQARRNYYYYSIPIPKVTKEHRESLSKNAKALFVKCKENIRDIQNKYTKTVKNKEKSEGLSQDDVRSVSEQLKLIADQYIEQAEKMLNDKQQELKGDPK
ncbi:ribosome-recycling factor, mitochondrial-like [Diaphorina citri]|uniref:Ribosome-recycling factor, mitochondrial n=1 Tax=Diaphorina citri TaxID=121845 RepID=A0A1S4EPL3_DIACI|nr:ribosome-recycling factor, mitochondrial-like [Diaphorina citri]